MRLLQRQSAFSVMQLYPSYFLWNLAFLSISTGIGSPAIFIQKGVARFLIPIMNKVTGLYFLGILIKEIVQNCFF